MQIICINMDLSPWRKLIFCRLPLAMNVQMILGFNVKRLRLQKGISQEELALRIELVDQAYISQLERGKRNPTAVILALVARGLDSTPGELFDTTGINENWATGPIEVTSTRTDKRSV